MDKVLCRHKDEGMFENLGYGVIKNDLDEKFVLVEWLLSKPKHFIMKSYLYILDENELNGYRS